MAKRRELAKGGRNAGLVRVWDQHGRGNGVHEVEWRCSERGGYVQQERGRLECVGEGSTMRRQEVERGCVEEAKKEWSMKGRRV